MQIVLQEAYMFSNADHTSSIISLALGMLDNLDDYCNYTVTVPLAALILVNVMVTTQLLLRQVSCSHSVGD